MESLPKICGPALYEALRPYEAVASVMELLDSLLQFDPDHRLNAEQALALPYFEPRPKQSTLAALFLFLPPIFASAFLASTNFCRVDSIIWARSNCTVRRMSHPVRP